MKTFKLGIIGAGWIADQMGKTLTPIPGYEVYAIASRTLEKAQAFAARYGCTRVYDSYEALVQDPDVDLVYIRIIVEQLESVDDDRLSVYRQELLGKPASHSDS